MSTAQATLSPVMATKLFKLPQLHPLLTVPPSDLTFTAPTGVAFLQASALLSVPARRSIRKAALVSCGGLCPGINTVLASLAQHLQTANAAVFAVMDGFQGFSKAIVPWHWSADVRRTGGSVLRCSRGGWDLDKITAAIEAQGFDAVFIIGGDGTHRGIAALSEALPKNIAIVGLPKTIDNDVYGFDRCFGFESAVDIGRQAVEAGFIEASSVDMGIGVVRLMGRHSGHIALGASIAHGGVDICLIPEVPATMAKVVAYAENVLSRTRKCVIVVAEGCSLSDPRTHAPGTDLSGNPLLTDIGQLLQQELKAKLAHLHPVLKYIDPTYLLRGCAPVTSDLRLCSDLALAAVAGALAGYTGFSVGPVAGCTALVPVSHIVYDDCRQYRSRNPILDAGLQLRWHFRQPDLI